MSLPRYPEYKDSGIPWVGEVPSHWHVERFKWLIARNDGGVWGDDPDGISDTVVLRSTEQTVDGRWRIDDPATRKLSERERLSALLAEGDLLLTKSSGSALHIGKTTLVDKDVAELSACYSNFMQRIRVQPRLSPKIAWYLLNNGLARVQLDLLSNSTTGLANLNGEMIGELMIPTAPEIEQVAISKFLERETAKIDALIAEQETLLAMLAEKRQATISHAVTRGLDSDVPMKDSGVAWLGEVPAHWETVRLRHLATLNPSKTEVEDDGDPDVPFLPMEAIGEDGSIRVDQERPLSQLQNGYSYFRNGDVVVAKITPCFENGKGALISDLPRGYGFGTTELIVVRSVGCLRPAFLSLVLSSSLFRKLAEGAMYGAGGQKRVPDEFVREFTVCVPPVEEQDAIWEEVAKQTALLRSLELQSISAIALLRERRSALIAAAVTGKIDVRGAA